jgi:hypothetical protein
LAPNTFAGKHIDELRYNCEQSIQCGAHNGDFSQEELEDDPRGRCLEMSAKQINAQPAEKQLNFLIRFNGCAALEHCPFITCITSQAMGFGEQQRASVEHYCNARLACDMVRGTFSGSTSDALQFCLSRKIPELNQYTSDRQRAYTMDFPMCSALGSCEFFDCFHY